MEILFGIDGVVYYLSVCVYLVAITFFLGMAFKLARRSNITGTKIFFVSFIAFLVLSIISGLLDYEFKEVAYIVNILDLVSAAALLLSMLGFKSFVNIITTKS